MRSRFRTLTTAVLLAALISAPASAADPAATPAATLAAFNQALTGRSLDGMLPWLLEGGVQLSLQPAHTGMGATQKIGSDLRAHWSMIAPVLFAATKTYTRRAEIVHSRIEGGIATLWTRTTTESTRADKPGTSKATFVEMYVLVLENGAWKIAAIADSRRPNDVGMGPGGG